MTLLNGAHVPGQGWQLASFLSLNSEWIPGQGHEGNMRKVEIFNNKSNARAILTVLQDFYNIAQGVCSGKGQILSTKPVLQADAPSLSRDFSANLIISRVRLMSNQFWSRAFFCARVAEVVKI